MTYPDGRTLRYSYDGLDQLNTVSDLGVAQPIADYDYLGMARVLERSYPQNGTRLTFLNDTGLDDAGSADTGYDGLRRDWSEFRPHALWPREE